MAKKILFINQEIAPYVPETHLSLMGRHLPQAMQERGHEIRTFVPKWGTINERRGQLHEVIRLSGMNLIIDDTDHPLIIKVASIQAARMQVYFIDNDDYFHKRRMMVDENGIPYPDNIERAIFYARGVLETVKKLRWCPDVIYCQGWVSAIVPFYIKTAFCEEPAFDHAKVVTALYNDMPDSSTAERFAECLQFRSATPEAAQAAGIELAAPDSLMRLAVTFSDGIIEGESGAMPEMMELAKAKGIPTLTTPAAEEQATAYNAFFDSLIG